MNFALDGDGNIKIACFKKAEYGAEAEAHIERPVPPLGVIAAEALRKRAGVKAADLYGVFEHLHGVDARALTGAEAQQFPAVPSRQKNDSQQRRRRSAGRRGSF